MFIRVSLRKYSVALVSLDLIVFHRDDMMHGKGVYQFENSDWCSGMFESDEMSGDGEFYFANGDKFAGQFKNDMMHGRGVFYWSSDGSTYEGEFENGKIQATGKKIFQEGSSYVGPFVDGKPHGKGFFFHLSKEVGFIRSNEHRALLILNYSGTRYYTR